MGGSESKQEEKKPEPETPLQDLKQKKQERREQGKDKQNAKVPAQLESKSLTEVRKSFLLPLL